MKEGMSSVEPLELAQALSSLPDAPGVYLFKDKSRQIVYIGKALSLRSRVKSYWNNTSWRERPKLAVMMPKVMDLEVILTNSEKEALILEANLVRQHLPRYNVHLKDDKRYPWLALTYDESFPRLIMVRDPGQFRKQSPRARVFGPYVEAGAMWETVKVLRKVFPLRQRRKPLFKDRPCMNYYIGLCMGPCQNLIKEEPYDRIVKQVELFLSGRQKEVVSQLKQEMEQASANLEFELAGKIRDRLAALQTVIEKQQVCFDDSKVNEDILAEAHNQCSIAICLLRIREGKLTSSETVTLPLVEKTSADEAFQSFVDQYYTACEDIVLPSEVILPYALEDMNALSELLSQKLGKQVRVHVPQRARKMNLLALAQKNAQQSLEKQTKQEDEEKRQVENLLEKLRHELNLTVLPRRIECFDISNIHGTNNVASMVVFENGKAKKSDYRQYKIKSVEGQANDFASMKEVVGRRYRRLLEEGKDLPELIIIDGGKGQLNAALEALAELKISKQNIFGLAKKQEELYYPGGSKPILLPRQSEALFLLQRVRDEAHRFAVTFHRKLRAKKQIKSGLDSIPGIGSARRKALLDHFGSLSEMKAADVEQLQSVPTISKLIAAKIYQALHPESDG